MTSTKRFAKVYRNIHQDPEWRALTTDAQWLYVHLLSQPSLSNAGVLILHVAKWAKGAHGMTVQRVEAALVELRRHMVVVDQDTAELLVRSYIRNDIVPAGTPYVLKSALKATLMVESEPLRAALLDEIRRIDRVLKPDLVALIDQLAGTVKDRSSKGFTEGFGEGSAEGYAEGRVEVEVVVANPGNSRNVTTHLGDARKIARDEIGTRSAEPERARSASYSKEFEEWWEHYPRKADKRKAFAAWARARRRATDAQLIEGARRYAADPNREDQFTKYPEGWLNGDGWLDDPLPARYPAGENRPAQPTAAERKRSEHADVWRQVSDDPAFTAVPSLRELGQ